MLRCVVRKLGYLQNYTSLRNFVLKATPARSLDPNPSLGASPGLIPDPSPSHSLALDLEPGSELESEFVSNSGLESGVSCESMSYQDTDSYPVPDSDPDVWRFLCNSKASCFLLARPWHSVTSLSVISSLPLYRPRNSVTTVRHFQVVHFLTAHFQSPRLYLVITTTMFMVLSS